MDLGEKTLKTRRETFKFWDLVQLILEVWQYMEQRQMKYTDEPITKKLIQIHRQSSSQRDLLCNTQERVG